MRPEPERLFIRAPNWLGDAVMALPAMAAVRAGLPGAHLTVGAVAATAPIFHEVTDVRPDAVVEIDPARELDSVRAGSFDAALLLTNSFRTALVARRGGIGERWGYGGSLRGTLLTRAIRRPRRVHQVEYYLRLVEALGFAAPAALTPRLGISERTAARARDLLADAGVAADAVLVGVAPGAAYGHAKRWPPARLAQVVDRLAREGATAVLVGAAGDRDAGRAIESALPPGARLVNLIGRTSLRVFAGVAARCRAFVSNDSGAMHVAAAAGVPVTAIFGPTDERVTAPSGPPGLHDVLRHDVFCRPCMLRECPIDHRCMTRITVDEVYASVARRLEARR